ncbi:MAG: starch-binding protein [Ruminococcus sp.]|nr:starch-binding protein [Ruminococcus sp.]
MFTKRLISLIISILMVLTMFVIPATTTLAAENDVVATADNVTGYNLPSDIHNGNILHAFNWKLKEVTQYAAEIAAAGYTAVQVSPIQCTKNTTNDGAYSNDWWCFYQPTDLKIGNELGNEADLREMCDTLDDYGIKVICDVVANHVQNSTSKAEAANVNATLKSYLRNTSGTTLKPYIDSTRAGQTTTDLNSQLPDLDTSNKNYQNYLISYLNTLADCGVDGFRFDAAKHIETPDDGSVASDFWPTITNAIKAKNSNAYIYGEVLGLNGLIPITAYTKYIDVTDFAYGSTVRNAIKTKKASNSLANYGYTGSQKADNVLWLESHDTFTTNPSNSDSSNFLTIDQQIVGWAVVGARKDAPALYLVRTNCAELDITPELVSVKYDELIGAPGAADTWKSPAVTAVNQFKNEFVGQSETVSANGSLFFVQRGTTGMVIANLATGSASVSQACTMANGTYTDQVSGNKFTVANGKITGNVGPTGVAVVYNAKKIAPKAIVKLNSIVLGADTLNGYTGETATITVSLENATSGTVKISNLAAVNVSATEDKYITLNSSIDYGDGIDVTVTATNGTQTTENTYKVYKKDANEKKRVYFDNSVTQWPAVHVYCKSGESRSTELVDFPGYAMTKDTSNPNLYYYDVPANTNYVKFSEGLVPKHIGHTAAVCGGYCGRTMPPTVIYYGTANSAANRESGGYKLTGSMIFEKLEFKDYGEYPVATLSASDVSYPSEKPSEPKPTTPSYPSGTLILGDLDFDMEATVLDATLIQKHVASMLTLNEDALFCGDVDGDKETTVLDATAIQLHLAQKRLIEGLGKPIEKGDIEDPTIPVETKTITLNDTDAFNGEDIYVFAYDGQGGTNGDWPGQKMTKSGSKYTVDIDASLTTIKFVGVYSEVTESATPDTIETIAFAVKDSAYTLESLEIKCTQKWSAAYIHLWNTDPIEPVTTTWPGIKMYGSSGNYKFNIPADHAYTQYKFNNNAGQESNTYYLVEPETTRVYFTNIYNWKAVYFHAWQTGGGGTAWPGLEMTKVETNAQGQDVYAIDIPLNTYNNVIFNNKGAGIQTATLALQGIPNEGFYPLSGTGQNIQCETYVYGE